MRKQAALFSTFLLLLVGLSGCSGGLTGDVKPPATDIPMEVTLMPTEILPTVMITPAETPEDEAEESNLEINQETAITGRVYNGSGGELPRDTEVVLHVFQSMQQIMESKTSLNEDYEYEFVGLEWADGQIFILSVDYDGLTFSSDVIRTEDISRGDVVVADIPVYDQSYDGSGLWIDRAHVFINIPDENLIQVVIFSIITNPTDHVIISDEGDAVLWYPLPENVSNLQVDNGFIGERFLLEEEGLGDTMFIRPGSQQHEVLFAYDLPYEQGMVVPVVFPLPVKSMLVALPASGIEVENDLLIYTGQNSLEGQIVDMYQIENFPAERVLDLKLTGSITGVENIDQNSMNEMTLGLGVFAITLVGIGIWTYFDRARRSRLLGSAAAGVRAGSIEDLLDAVIDLDSDFDDHKIDERTYKIQRKLLKKQIQSLMKKQQD